MNLGELTLVPFQTKALLEDGSRVLFIGHDKDPSYPFNFAYVKPTDPKKEGSFCCFRHDGVSSTDAQVAQIVKPWVPTSQDVVSLCGLLIRLDNGANVQDYYRVNARSANQYVVDAPHSTDRDFFYLKRDGYRYIAHRDQLRLIKRPKGN